MVFLKLFMHHILQTLKVLAFHVYCVVAISVCLEYVVALTEITNLIVHVHV